MNLETMKRLALKVVPGAAPRRFSYREKQRDLEILSKRARGLVVASSDEIRKNGLQLRRLPIVGTEEHETKLVKKDGGASQRGLLRRLRATNRGLERSKNKGRLKAGVKAKPIETPPMPPSEIQNRIRASVTRFLKIGIGKEARLRK